MDKRSFYFPQKILLKPYQEKEIENIKSKIGGDGERKKMVEYYTIMEH